MASRSKAIYCFLLLSAVLALAAPAASQDAPITPTETLRLFNGRDLSNFYTWLVDSKYEDPTRVFSVVDQVDGAPAIRVSGQFYGSLITRQRYANYRLVVEFRWGLATWAARKDKPRDSGILLHGQEPDGNYKADFNGPWTRSVECQIIEGGVGDFILVAGYDPAGMLLRTLMTVAAGKDRDGEAVYDPSASPAVFQGGRINWYGRDPDWRGVLGFRGRQDVESPLGEWTRVEAVCDGDRVTNIVNGKVVNSGTGSSLSAGKLLFQSEGAEIYFRKIDLEPLR